ncbi:DUF3017 domain-containing protein [Nocardiopsis xinjiangensis]|uniref:DUF3017 domain-containing protein n=1 Tax=Nocardiopsis xinjiangensis TaxID=124285 RepID=UPI000A01B55C|nr:DUF3017 domain-containing protein [Nocardiopsis xinjiangensis]
MNRTGRYAVDRAEQTEVADSGTPDDDVPQDNTSGDGESRAEEVPPGEGEHTPEQVQEAHAEEAQGSGTAGSVLASRIPPWLAQVPYALVLSGLAAGIAVVGFAYFKRGPAIIAGALVLAAVFRLVLPKDWIGMLAVRRRWVDLTVLVGLACLLIVLAWVAPQLST